MNKPTKTPYSNPGSPEAKEQGCTCPVMDNHYGDGFGNPPMWYITGGCPLHWPDETKKPKKWPPVDKKD